MITFPNASCSWQHTYWFNPKQSPCGEQHRVITSAVIHNESSAWSDMPPSTINHNKKRRKLYQLVGAILNYCQPKVCGSVSDFKITWRGQNNFIVTPTRCGLWSRSLKELITKHRSSIKRNDVLQEDSMISNTTFHLYL